MEFCGKCGRQMQGGYCKDCQRKTLIANSNFERGFDILQIPLSFDLINPSYGSFVYKSGHAMHSMNLDTDTPFGNLQLIFFNILQDVEHLNGRILECYKSYAVGMYYDFSAKITDHQRIVEEIIYWIRRIVDRLISLHWLLFASGKNKNYPKAIKIDSIGRLLELKDGNIFLSHYTKGSLDFLRFLNEASNAYKHSFVHGESPSSRVGKEEPLVITLGLVNNNVSKKQIYNHKSLAEAILMFISFYKESRENLEEFTL